MVGNFRNYLSARFVLPLAIFVSALMHLPHFSKDIISGHVWRQTQTMSTAVNFYEEDFNILNPRRNDRGSGDGTFRMEFPLFQWLTAGLWKVFGRSDLIVRLFVFAIGLFSLLAMYLLLREAFISKEIAAIGTWAFNFSPAFYYYTISPIPDNLALSFSLWGLALFFKFINTKNFTELVIAYFLMGLGALVKLPFVLYFSLPVAYFIFNSIESKNFSTSLKGLSPLIPALTLPASWYLSVVGNWHGNGIVRGVFNNEKSLATLFDYLLHNLISTLPELLLNYAATPFFLAGIFFLVKLRKYVSVKFIAIATLGVGLIAFVVFEINMIAKDHDYYFFPFYPLLFMLVGYGAYHLLNSGKAFLRTVSVLLLFILPLTAYLRMQTRWNPESPGFNKDALIYKSDLQAASPKEALCIVGNDISHFIFFYHLNKKGWGFDNNQLTGDDVARMIDEGAQYLYSDSRIIDESPQLQVYIDSMVLERGTMRVFRLRK